MKRFLLILGLVAACAACPGSDSDGNGSAGGSAEDEGSAGVGTATAGVGATGGSGESPAAGVGGSGGEAGTAGAAASDGGEAGAAGSDGTAGVGGAAGNDGTAGAGDLPPACDPECEVGTHCALVEVQCIRAPCPPQPECVESPQCGGFAAFACPGAGTCEDDPRDDCDPQKGGADCSGICTCPVREVCQNGQVWNGSPEVCACAATDGSGEPEKCGDTVCAEGMVCCNASCGICAPPDGACIEIACQ